MANVVSLLHTVASTCFSTRLPAKLFRKFLHAHGIIPCKQVQIKTIFCPFKLLVCLRPHKNYRSSYKSSLACFHILDFRRVLSSIYKGTLCPDSLVALVWTLWWPHWPPSPLKLFQLELAYVHAGSVAGGFRLFRVKSSSN